MTKPKKTPMPHDRGAEQSLLGAVFHDQGALDDILEAGLNADDFYFEAHKSIFAGMIGIHAENKPVDIITVSEALDQTGRREKTGGPAYLSELADSVATAVNAAHHAQMVKQRATQRRLIDAANRIAETARGPHDDVNELLEVAERDILSVREGNGNQGLTPLDATGFRKTLAGIDERATGAGLPGVPSGFTDLDRMTGGWTRGDLIILAGRPSMGKTALALNLAINAAMPTQREAKQYASPFDVAFFSLEMSAEQIRQRLLAMLAQVDLQVIRTGRGMVEADYQKIIHAATALGGVSIYLDDSANQTIMGIRSKARRLKSRLDQRGGAGLGLIIVDYLQLMRGRGESREQAIAEISRSMKALAKELNVPVLALSQLNRQLEQRTDKRPNLSDLRESGSLEQDADLVLFVYRHCVYSATAPQAEAELLVRKHRQGPTGDLKMLFFREFSQFRSRTTGGES